MLKLQEIQHYNGLKFMVTGSQRKNILMSKSKGDGKYQLNTVYSLHGINKWHVIPLESLDPDSNLTSIGIEHIKPILFPLSSLAEEIEINGKKFVPQEELYKEYDNVQFEQFVNQDGTIDTYTATFKVLEDVFTEFILYCGKVDRVRFETVKKLLEWKIDVFNLIGQGKAVSVLDFDINPYK